MDRSRHRVRCAVIGAGMAGILSAIRLDEAGLTDFTVYEKARRGRWDLAGEHLPGALLRRALAPLLLLVRPDPGWSHRYASGPEIHAYLQQVAEDRGVVPRIRFGDPVTRCPSRTGGGRLTTAAGHARRGRRGHRRHRGAPPSQVPRHRRVGHLRGGHVPQRPLGPRCAARRRPGRGSSAPGRRPCRSSPPSSTASPTCPCSSAPPSGSCRRRIPAYSDEEREAWRNDPRWAGPNPPADFGHVRHLLQRGRGRRIAEIKMIEQACLANLEDNVRRSGPPAAAASGLPGRLQAADRLPRLLRRHPAAERRAGHRGHRGRRARRCPHGRRPAPRARRARAGHRLPGRCLHAADGGRRAPRRSLSTRPGARVPRPTCPSRSPGSPTSSC